MRGEGDILKANDKLAHYVARKFAWSNEPHEDLVQEARIGMLLALRDDEPGVPLGTRMYWRAKSEILQHLRRVRIIRFDRHGKAWRLPTPDRLDKGCFEMRAGAPLPEEAFAGAEMARCAARKASRLPRRHAAATIAYYGLDGHDEGRTLRQVGSMLGVSEARACKLVKQSIGMLRP